MGSEQDSCRCSRMSRRSFVGSMGAAAAATQLGVFQFASSLFAAPEKPGKPTVRVAFVRPDKKRFFMGWPGADWDNVEHEKRYSRILKDAADDLDVDLRIREEPLWKDDTGGFLQSLDKEQPDGLILVSMCLHPTGWQVVDPVAKKRGDIPTIVFSPVGTSFTQHLQETRDLDGVFVGATENEEWLSHGLRMLDTKWQMAHTRLTIVRGNERKEQQVEGLGTTLQFYPEQELCRLENEQEVTDKIRAIASYYEQNAERILEPTGEDILNAAKLYVVCRTVMEQENSDGISINCLPLVSNELGSENHMWEPCLAFSRLRDEGIVAGCESDVHAALGSRLSHLLLQKPGFMQDPAPLTVDNTLVGAHCTCPTRLAGFDSDPAPFILRNHQESDRGVAPQVLWPEGEKVTIMDMWAPPGTMHVGTGTVIKNIEDDQTGDDPYEEAGGCRTSVKISVDDVDDTRDVYGFHQLFILGDEERRFRNYAQLANIDVKHI